jgi:hypothetical protein
MEALDDLEPDPFTTFLSSEMGICRSCKKEGSTFLVCLASNIHPLAFIIPRAPGQQSRNQTKKQIIQIHLWNPWEHC